VSRYVCVRVLPAILATLVGCTTVSHTGVTTQRARHEALGPASVLLMHREHVSHRDHVSVTCPIALEDPGLVLARVGRIRITTCDLAIARVERFRAGLSAEDFSLILHTLVEEALLASEAPDVREPEVERLLANTLVREEARTAVETHRPAESEITRWLEAHLENSVREERVHIRRLVFATQNEAREAIRLMREGTAFEDLLPRSLDPHVERDWGDLGLVRATGDDIEPALVVAGFGLTEAGSVAQEPVPLTQIVTPPRPPGRRHRPRPQRITQWNVVQLIARYPEERIPEATLRARASERIFRDRFATERGEARDRLTQTAAERCRAAIVASALATVRINPIPHTPVPRRVD
jgi:hypothetical protein